MTYSLTVSETFVARHFLTVPDPGPEGDPHTHRYELTVELAGESLDEWGYLVDIDNLTRVVANIVDRYRDRRLNDLPAFDGNPSVERFCRVIADRLAERLDTGRCSRLTVTLREDDTARAAYEREL